MDKIGLHPRDDIRGLANAGAGRPIQVVGTGPLHLVELQQNLFIAAHGQQNRCRELGKDMRPRHLHQFAVDPHPHPFDGIVAAVAQDVGKLVFVHLKGNCLAFGFQNNLLLVLKKFHAQALVVAGFVDKVFVVLGVNLQFHLFKGFPQQKVGRQGKREIHFGIGFHLRQVHPAKAVGLAPLQYQNRLQLNLDPALVVNGEKEFKVFVFRVPIHL